MADFDDEWFKQLTGAEMDRLWKLLLKKMQHEPVVDPGFHRVPKKLEHIASQSTEFAGRLRSVAERWRVYREKFGNAKEGLEKMPASFSAFGQLERTGVDPGKCRELKLRMRTANAMNEDVGMSIRLTTLEFGNRELWCLLDGLVALRLAALLMGMTKRVTAGTKQALTSNDSGAADDVLSDATDEAIDIVFKLKNVLPMFHIVRAIFAHIHMQSEGQQGIEEELQRGWDTNVWRMVLSGYYEWWVEKGGESEVAAAVASLEHGVPEESSVVTMITTPLDKIREKFEALKKVNDDIKTLSAADDLHDDTL